MEYPVPEEQFIAFLCKAKRATYAAEDDKARVKSNLSGSHQLEYRQGALLYRDIYYGGDFFVGLETVYNQGDPFWAMSYAGGIDDGVDNSNKQEIYKFLQKALRQLPTQAPYRGPGSLSEGPFTYLNRYLGTPIRFSGVETISVNDVSIYKLHYSGGLLKE